MPLMLEVEENENCVRVPQLIFNTLEEAQRRTHVRTTIAGGGATFAPDHGMVQQQQGQPVPLLRR